MFIFSFTVHDTLSDVDQWFYYLAVDENIDTIMEQIIASDYDLVVIDPVITEIYSTHYDMASAIAAMHDAGKLVIAYIDIGQAEDYRTYWEPGWQIGNPTWIVGGDPDGWEGNYPVAYWYDEWQSIWFDPETGYLPLIVDLGFDGVYLDWVEAYSDENVIAFAELDGVDPVQEMIWFIMDISEYGKSRDADFVIIAQNAAELAEFDDYVAVIDAIAQEHVWFDGGATGIEGDCPLPATDDDIGTDTYIASLSLECRQLYEDYADSTLHVSSEEYLHYLQIAQTKGLRIFTVDYALQPENIAWVYAESRAYGFIPFVSNRPLNQFVPPYEGS
ncbi:MAG: hypothetical protein CUN56_08585 [Phototrophicales bacterium]|nr:MAG: hypothetical protein CUN56_08585 [Phototrophicales bacterium]